LKKERGTAEVCCAGTATSAMLFNSTCVGRENSMNVVCIYITNTDLHDMKRCIQASVYEHQ